MLFYAYIIPVEKHVKTEKIAIVVINYINIQWDFTAKIISVLPSRNDYFLCNPVQLSLQAILFTMTTIQLFSNTQ